MELSTKSTQPMKEFFTRFFEYNFQINGALDSKFKSYEYLLDPEIIRLANHVINAHQIWIERVEGTITLKNPWEEFPIELFGGRNQVLFEKSLALVGSVDLEEVISFQSFSGAAFEKKVADILVHIVNHTTYHRGQIAQLMRKSGLEPVASDYIHWAKL